MNKKVQKIEDISKRRGFIWNSCEIYGGLAGFYDYGHLGTLIKRKFEDLWRNYFLGLDTNFYEVQPSEIMPKKVFVASGHLESFTDPVVRCKKCGLVERADQILKEEFKEGLSSEELSDLIKKHKIKCPRCKGEMESFGTVNLMFPIEIGPISKEKAYLRPETAQGAYLMFKREFQALRKKLPLGLAIIGKAFRNEISPRQGVYRMREFTQAELQIFFDPDKINQHHKFDEVADYKLRLFPVKNRKEGKTVEITCKELSKKLPKFYVYYLARVQQFYLDILNLPRAKLRFRELTKEEKAFYNLYHWDIEAETNSFGWIEIGGVHFRTDHDLKGHQKISGESMVVNIEGKKFIPNVLELSFGVDRNIYALMDISYREEKERLILAFPRILSPFDLALFPLVNKDNLPQKAIEVKKMLEENGFNVFYDDSGSIGRRYRRTDEIGVSVGVTIDYESLEQNDCTLRDRDTMKQIRVKTNGLPKILRRFLAGEKLENLGEIIG